MVPLIEDNNIIQTVSAYRPDNSRDRPLCGGMRCNIEVHDVAAVMAEHDKHIENPKSGGRDHEEINPRYTVGMVFEKRPPGLRRRF